MSDKVIIQSEAMDLEIGEKVRLPMLLDDLPSDQLFTWEITDVVNDGAGNVIIHMKSAGLPQAIHVTQAMRFKPTEMIEHAPAD